ncbi:uncharacterized protein [Anoplolepis gracilipes]|uniref:uncharacterized protein n=1 Tax=Anoplolepis gracilipes TaxID=354296 RepID=UPI003B9E75F6
MSMAAPSADYHFEYSWLAHSRIIILNYLFIYTNSSHDDFQKTTFSTFHELFCAFDDNSYENTSEDEILIWRTLINLVQPNLILYQKKHKGYTDKNKKIQLWNNIGASLTPPITDSDIIYVENEKATSIAGFIELFSSTYNLLTSQSNASTSVAKVIVSTITPQKLTPSADTKKRKWQTNDEIDTVMLESSKNISSLANTLEMALKQNLTSVESQTTKPELPHAVENMMSGIALGLSKVCEERQMDCFISILACINEFIKK